MKQNNLPIDIYTIVHFMYGYIAKKYGYSNKDILVGAVLYEMIEPKVIDFLQKDLKFYGWGHESKHNVLWDILIAEFGAMAFDFDNGELT